MRVGFVGTGTMGHPMASCLLDAGHELTVNDLRREATTDLCEAGRPLGRHPARGGPSQRGGVHLAARPL